MSEAEAEVLVGHVLDVLATLPAESVSCCVTSPPYWSLRKYDAPDVVWGGDAGCPHDWAEKSVEGEGYTSALRWQQADKGYPASRDETPEAWTKEVSRHATCSRCGAWRGQFGLEPTPELYVEHTLLVLRAIRRVLRPDGVVWWNIGDGYASGASGHAGQHGLDGGRPNEGVGRIPPPGGGLKPKDLVLMPERVALAAQADGWWVRSRIAWHKPNAMPESAKDRPTDAWEHIYMLTKSARYWYDQEAVREAATWQRENHAERWNEARQERVRQYGLGARHAESGGFEAWQPEQGRNLRNVWTFPTAQTPEAHFATFPEELPRRCIEASCPKEICAKCGTARVRITETEYIKNRPSAGNDPRSRSEDKLATLGADDGQHSGYQGNNLLADTKTTGWTSCACAEPDYQPGLVLDPFAGIGTTLIVAKRLGRRSVGIELSEKYAAMAQEKLRLWWRSAALTAPAAPGEQGRMPL